eukprot:TRINITY_DN31193_c0_g1_i1.p1 TRINITY_DN31193_c0_g1~~TRINITY_DN31193_c0_g1_i1.p1  ORF type:complete len:346 (-),score=90.52 TRINITY_DN31193_c0_g1_i1:213-1172(-)
MSFSALLRRSFAAAPRFAPTRAALRSLPIARGLASSGGSAGASGRAGSITLAAAGLACVAVGGALQPVSMSTQDELKKQVGYKAVDDYVRSGMVVGLGTGSTAYFAVERLGQKLKSGELKDIVAIPTSKRTQEQAQSLGIPLTTLDSHSVLDVAIDGADSVDPKLNLVKGGGGAHFREKIVEAAAKTFVVIVDDSKMCDGLGPHFPLPVEIVPFCHEHTARVVESLPALKGCEAVLRLGSSSNNKKDGDKPAVTDNGNYILDLNFKTPLKDPVAAAQQLKSTIGVVEHGLFVNMASVVVIAGKDGISVKQKPKGFFSRL